MALPLRLVLAGVEEDGRRREGEDPLLRSAVAGLTVMSTPVAQRVWAVRSVQGAPQSLTERERAVLAAVCAGDSNAAIAGALFLSETSVKQVIVALQRSFGVSNRIQLAIRGSALGLDTA